LASNRNDSAKARPAGNDTLSALDRPVSAGVNAAGFGSDVVADALRATDIPYIALNPGASYTTAWSIILATNSRRCCCACMRKAR
jgi:hypothetical protein